MSLQSVEQLSFGFLPSLPIKIEISPALLSSDAGLLPVREFDERIGLTDQFAKALSDERHPSWMEQSNLVMVRQRIYGIIADYVDQNDHDTLRSDPIFKLIADRLPEDGDLASQPTLSRFENAVTISDLWRLRDTLVDQFIQSFDLGVTFTIGMGMNPRLKKLSEDLLDQALKAFTETRKPQRLFLPVEYQADSWPKSRPVVIKVEANAQGTNRRAVVTNRLGWSVEPQATYDEYAGRGESENRNKELKCELQADRLSDHRFLANFFRLYLHAAALNLMIRLRQAAALPAKTPAQLGLPNPLPAAVLDEPDRKRYFNRRRDRDPLGEGFASTWRTRLIKVAAEIIVSARRILVRLSGTWPHLDHFEDVSRAVLGVEPVAEPSG